MPSCPWCGVLMGGHERMCRERQMKEIGLLHMLVRELDSRDPDIVTVTDLRTKIKNCRPFK
jgi:hypothetical protein